MYNTFNLFFDGDMEEKGQWIETMPFEDEDEGNVDFNLVKMKDWYQLLSIDWEKIGCI